LLTDNYSEREALMNFVIVGAGPTGVELAGALAELKNVVLPKDYPDLDIRQMNIHLVEAAGKVLPPMSDESSARAQRYLEKLGVQVWLDTMVKDYDGKKVLTNKKDLPTRTLIWAAGVTGNTLEGIPSESMEKGRILVDEFNRIKGSESIFAIGDVALMKTEQKPKGDPMVAQTAIQQGETLAKNLLRSSSGKEMKPFQYRDKGSMATVGRNKAVVDIKKFHFGGLFAWFLWMVVHLVALVGFRNRAVALLNWIYNYFSYDKGIRLIIRPWKRKISIQKEETPTV
ncbi:MAG: FAD-dependent oxidoreductase, partial [Bacteroidota bacterium]|nr:FAD-dependent oxidoreductase [Bacteroidota bacterium]